MGPPGNYELTGTKVEPAYDPEQHRFTWSDAPPAGQQVIIRYTSKILAGYPLLLVNTAELSQAGGVPNIVKITVYGNHNVWYLPLIEIGR